MLAEWPMQVAKTHTALRETVDLQHLIPIKDRI